MTTSLPDIQACEAYLTQVGTDDVTHLGGNVFSDHLKGVYRVLQRWDCDPQVSLAGLMHSIYGTEGFQGFCLGLDKRPEVSQLVGARAERTAWVNCVMDRSSLDELVADPSRPRQVRARDVMGGEVISLTQEQLEDLVLVHLADWLEQVEREAQKPAPEHGWEKAGDAWGYRREAYRNMAQMVGGPGLAEWEAVYKREPSHTRHLHQRFTPLIKPYQPPAITA